MAGIGPTGRRVAQNLRRIRMSRDGMSAAALSRRLAAIGWPVLDTALMKTEKGSRGVYVDDLVAFAVALGTTPNALLLPPAGAPGAAFTAAELLPAGEGQPVLHSPAVLWAWADGDQMLPRRPVPSQAEQFAFLARHRPHLFQAGDPRSQYPDLYSRIEAGVREALERGVPPVTVRAMTELAISEALTEREG